MLIAAVLVIPAIIIEESSPGKPWETVGVALNYAIWIAYLSRSKRVRNTFSAGL